MSDTTNRVPFKHWLWLAAITIAVWVLSFMWADKSMGQERGDLGYLTANTHLCHTTKITEDTIATLDRWAALIARLEAAGGAIFLSKEDNTLGNSMSGWCNTLGEGYPVVVQIVSGDHVLLTWDPSLDFLSRPFIVRLTDLQTGGLRL